MKTKALLKALKFMCLPTLAVLLLLFFGFFSISATIAFISSTAAFAVILRVLLVIAEIVLVVYMYHQYLDEEIVKEVAKTRHGLSCTERTGYTELQQLFSMNRGGSLYIYDTESPHVKVIELKNPTT
jgi:hypothetical protein